MISYGNVTAGFVYDRWFCIQAERPSHPTPAKTFVRRRHLKAERAKNSQVQRFNTGTNRPQTHLPGTTEHFANSSREGKKDNLWSLESQNTQPP